MMEGDVIDNLFGPMGGIFALGIGTGFTTGWALCQRTVVAIHQENAKKMQGMAEQRIAKMSDDFKSRDDECKARVAELERRIQELEQDRFQRAINDQKPRQ